MREHGKRVAAWFLTVVMVITMIMPYGGAGIPFADWVKAADLIDLSGKDGAHKVTVVATTETGLGNYYTGEAIEAPVTVKVDGEEVPSDCYDVVYTNNVNVSTATELAVATITGKPEKGYTGSNTAKFKIRVTPINKAKVKFASDMTLVSGKYYVPYVKNLANSPTVESVTWNGKVLVAEKDYYENVTLSENYLEIGSKGTTVIKGMNNFSGSKTYTWYLKAANIQDQIITLSNSNYSYDGKEKKPSVTIADVNSWLDENNDYQYLEEGVDYTLSYSSNINPGTATVTITGKDCYTGSTSLNYTISSGSAALKDISQTTVNVASCTYNGQAQTPAVTVKDGSTTLKQGTDYTVSYSANTNAGNGTVLISGCGKYTNTKSLTFKINPRDISKATLTAEPATYKYGAEVFSPKISVYDSKLGTTLTNKTDYTVASYVAKTAGTVSISATGKGNYTGTVTGTLTVNPLDVANTAKVTLNQTSFDQTGAEIRPTVTSVTSDGYTLTEGTDYTVSYKDNVAAGNLAKVIVTFKGNYTGSKTVYFTIISSLPDLSGAVCSTIADQTYTGAQIKPEVTVTYDGKTLTKDSDYTVSYGANVNCGTGTVTITGKNGYSGTKSVNFKISARALADCSLSYDESVKWTGSAAIPNIRITYGQKLLIEGTDYTVAYSNNINETTAATATVTGKGNFTGRKVLTYKITRDRTDVNASTITVDAIADQEYNAGQGLRPAVTVRNGGTILTLNTDYTVTYTNNYTAGSTAIVTITGINDYTGTRTVTFNVVALDLTNAKVVLEADSYEYTGMPQTPGVTSFTTVSGKTYTSMTNFTVNYSNNTNCGTATVTIKGKNANFTGNAVGTFTVTKKSINGAVFSNITACTFTGSEQKPTATVKIGTTTLAANADYELSYKNNINAGTGTITATGKGNYSGSSKTTFTIAARAISSCKAEYSKEMVYTGSEVKPSVKLTYGSYELKAGTDYTVSYSNNINETDSASIRITGNGNFSGTQACTFKITKIVTNINDSSISIASIGDQEYQGGEAIIPKLRITRDGVTLVEGESYTGNSNQQ